MFWYESRVSHRAARGAVENSHSAVHHLSNPKFCPIKRDQLYYPDWGSIEHALKSEGYKKARIWLDDRFFRQELNDLCKQHYVAAPGKGLSDTSKN